MEGFDLASNVWGCEVEPRMVVCSGTKSPLDMKSGDFEDAHDNLKAVQAVDEGWLHMPHDSSSQQVCSDFLTKLYTYVFACLERRIEPKTISRLLIDY